ncbi:MAG: SDR family oxidoreductase, partial [Rhodoblastus sp.]|nr:SDR family oxidoreductase [Rhodoblastus sp.]
SASVRTSLVGLDLSSGARAGLTAFLAAASRQFVDRNVTINHILPGVFDTDRIATATGRMAAMKGITPDEFRKQREAGIPAKRFGTADEFGKLCAFLASAHAGYITGQSFLIDGGAFNTVI